VLKNARTGYAPNGSLEDLVWRSSQSAAVVDEGKDGKVHRLSV